MQGDLDLKAVQEFVEKNPEHPVVRGMRNEILSSLTTLESVRTISENGDIASQALGKKYAYEQLSELFDRLGFGVTKSPSPKTSSYR